MLLVFGFWSILSIRGSVLLILCLYFILILATLGFILYNKKVINNVYIYIYKRYKKKCSIKEFKIIQNQLMILFSTK